MACDLAIGRRTSAACVLCRIFAACDLAIGRRISAVCVLSMGRRISAVCVLADQPQFLFLNVLACRRKPFK